MTTPHPTAIDDLARSWDDLVLGHPVDSDSASGAGEFMRTLQRPDHRLDANPAFVATLQSDLLDVWRREHHELDPGTESGPFRATNLPEPVPLQHRLQRSPRVPRYAGLLASAALLLLTLISAMALLASAWQPSHDRDRATDVISAPIVLDPATALGVLTTVHVPELPQSLSRMAIKRWIYPPHADAVTTDPLSGPLLLYVIEGEVTVALNGGEGVLLGDEPSLDNPLTSLSASTGRVEAGQSFLLPARTEMTTSNPGDREAILIAAPLNVDAITDWVLPFGQTVIDEVELAGDYFTFPPGPAQVTLEREVLAEGETIPAPPEGTLQLVGSESKFLAYLRRNKDGSVTNLEHETLRVLVLRVTGDGY